MQSEEQLWALEHTDLKVVETEPECAVKFLWRTKDRCATTTGYCCGNREQLRVWQHPLFLREGAHDRRLLLQLRLPELSDLRLLTSWCEEFGLWFEHYPAPPLVTGTVPLMLTANRERRAAPRGVGFDEWLLQRRWDRDAEGVGRLAELVSGDADWPYGQPEETQVTRLAALLPPNDVVTLNSYAHARRRYLLTTRRYAEP